MNTAPPADDDHVKPGSSLFSDPTKRKGGKLEPNSLVGSTSDARTVNNVMRHEYRVLSDDEKISMQSIKDYGLNFHQFLAGLGDSRELSLAKTHIEEAVMWAVKHLTNDKR